MAGKFYLIWLEGQGDTHVKVVDKETWEWINAPGVIAEPPENVRKAIEEYQEEKYRPCETRGSYTNDRALVAPGLKQGEQRMDSYTGAAEAAEEIMEWKRILGIKKFEDTFQGYIY